MPSITKDLREIEQADARRYKGYRRKMRAILRGVANRRGWITTNLHHLAKNAGLDYEQARFALGDLVRPGEIEILRFPDHHGDGLIRLCPKPLHLRD